MLTTLMISTANPPGSAGTKPSGNSDGQPHRRLPSNLTCAMGMLNGGCLIHEVPYLTNAVTQYRDYSAQEAQLVPRPAMAVFEYNERTTATA